MTIPALSNERMLIGGGLVWTGVLGRTAEAGADLIDRGILVQHEMSIKR